jgi:hypothetical protein
MFADGAPGRETQWRPESKNALYQMLFKELEQRDLKKNSRVPKCDVEGRSAR